MNMIFPDNKGIAISTVHCQSVVAGLKDFAFFKRYMMAPDKSYSRAAALKMYPPNNHVRAIDKLDIIIFVYVISGTGKQRLLPICGPDNDRFCG